MEIKRKSDGCIKDDGKIYKCYKMTTEDYKEYSDFRDKCEENKTAKVLLNYISKNFFYREKKKNRIVYFIEKLFSKGEKVNRNYEIFDLNIDVPLDCVDELFKEMFSICIGNFQKSKERGMIQEQEKK